MACPKYGMDVHSGLLQGFRGTPATRRSRDRSKQPRRVHAERPRPVTRQGTRYDPQKAKCIRPPGNCQPNKTGFSALARFGAEAPEAGLDRAPPVGPVRGASPSAASPPRIPPCSHGCDDIAPRPGGARVGAWGAVASPRGRHVVPVDVGCAAPLSAVLRHASFPSRALRDSGGDRGLAHVNRSGPHGDRYVIPFDRGNAITGMPNSRKPAHCWHLTR